MESRWIFGRRLLLMLRTANKPNVRLWVSPLMLHSFLVNLLKLSCWKQACNKHTFLIGRTRHMFIITGLRVLICAPFRTPWSKIPLAQLWKHGPLHSTKSSKHQHLPQHLNTFLMSDKWGVASWRSPFFKKNCANNFNRKYKAQQRFRLWGSLTCFWTHWFPDWELWWRLMVLYWCACVNVCVCGLCNCTRNSNDITDHSWRDLKTKEKSCFYTLH